MNHNLHKQFHSGSKSDRGLWFRVKFTPSLIISLILLFLSSEGLWSQSLLALDSSKNTPEIFTDTFTKKNITEVYTLDSLSQQGFVSRNRGVK